jgi:hypothetical protein
MSDQEGEELTSFDEAAVADNNAMSAPQDEALTEAEIALVLASQDDPDADTSIEDAN